MEKIDKKQVLQMFLNKSDCYADEDNGLPIPAMTFDAVWELINKLPDGYTTRNDEVVKMVQGKIKECEELEFLIAARILTDLLTKLNL